MDGVLRHPARCEDGPVVHSVEKISKFGGKISMMERECLERSCNAFLVLRAQGVVNFLDYDYLFKISDCQTAVDFSCELHVHKSIRKARRSCPDTGLCFCNQVFDAHHNELTCKKCNRWCHAACAGLEDPSLEELDRADFTCPLCQ